MFEKFSHWFEGQFTGKGLNTKPACQRPCEVGGCPDAGIYKAPKSRYHIEAGVNEWHWFCLIHVRDYNARWNYYANMSEAEIERERRADTTWQRPSWPMGTQSPSQWASQQTTTVKFQDPFNLFADSYGPSPAFSKGLFPPGSPEEKALSLFEVSIPFTPEVIQRRYRELVKKHHPDANKGSREDDETIKHINEAYNVLKRVVSLLQGL
ncbi:MAG: J domain-containing protein [Alphaproteobacteria bacterium]|nr:J domain-containing protein [Alphaproteobacteria bacterium]